MRGTEKRGNRMRERDARTHGERGPARRRRVRKRSRGVDRPAPGCQMEKPFLLTHTARSSLHSSVVVTARGGAAARILGRSRAIAETDARRPARKWGRPVRPSPVRGSNKYGIEKEVRPYACKLCAGAHPRQSRPIAGADARRHARLRLRGSNKYGRMRASCTVGGRPP